MHYIKIEEAANKWGLSIRRTQDLCRMGRVYGATRFGTNWMIPADAPRPADGRRKPAKDDPAAHRAMIRRSPFLDMTDLYTVPGSADAVTASLAHLPETQALFAAEIAYSRGEIDHVHRQARHFLENHSGLFAVVSGGLLLSLVAMWQGDIRLWNEARMYLYEAPCKDDADRDIVTLALASADSAIRNTKDFPDWFARGCFENLPRDAHPAARVYYIKYLMILAQELAIGNMQLEGVKGLGLMKMLPYIMEPMISQMVVDKIVMAEIYLRLLCAIAYHQSGNDALGAPHLDRAIRLCLADGLYGPLVEHRRQLGLFLDDRLAMIDPDALKKVKTLHKQLHAGWTIIHNAVTKKQVQVTLTVREREVARLAAFGMTDAQIARQLSLSEHTIGSLIHQAKNKIGISSRLDLGRYV